MTLQLYPRRSPEFASEAKRIAPSADFVCEDDHLARFSELDTGYLDHVSAGEGEVVFFEIALRPEPYFQPFACCFKVIDSSTQLQISQLCWLTFSTSPVNFLSSGELACGVSFAIPWSANEASTSGNTHLLLFNMERHPFVKSDATRLPLSSEVHTKAPADLRNWNLSEYR